MIDCPQCGSQNEEGAKNCQSCRINLYWATQYYKELAALRQASQLAPRPETAPFLIETSRRVDNGPTAGWLQRAIQKFGLKGAGKRVNTMTQG